MVYLLKCYLNRISRIPTKKKVHKLNNLRFFPIRLILFLLIFLSGKFQWAGSQSINSEVLGRSRVRLGIRTLLCPEIVGSSTTLKGDEG